MGSALGEAVAVAIHLKDVDVMGEAVEQGAGQAFRSEGLGPFIERQVAGNQRGAPFVALGDHLEEQFCPGFAESPI